MKSFFCQKNASTFFPIHQTWEVCDVFSKLSHNSDGEDVFREITSFDKHF